MNYLWFLSVYNFAHTFALAAAEKLIETYSILVVAFEKKTYLLLQGISAPYEHSAVLSGVASSALPLWHYIKETKTFIEWSAGQDLERYTRPGKPLSILSMVVMNDSTELHDLSDFVEAVNVHTMTAKEPSVAHILAAWSLSSKIVLNPSRSYYVEMITSSAETLSTPINNEAPLNTLTAPTLIPEEDRVD